MQRKTEKHEESWLALLHHRETLGVLLVRITVVRWKYRGATIF